MTTDRAEGGGLEQIGQAEPFWWGEFTRGRISEDQLTTLLDTLRNFDDIVRRRFTVSHPYDNPLTEYMGRFRRDRLLIDFPQEVLQLMDLRIVPTSTLVAFMQDHPQVGTMELERLRQATQAGEFDPDNQIQRNLEFTELLFLVTSNPVYGEYVSEFGNIPFLENPETPTLPPKEYFEARVSAYEAAKVYWLICQSLSKRRTSIVIGNSRFGSDFVTEPLREELVGLGNVTVVKHRIPSARAHQTTVFAKIAPEDVESRVIQGGEDVFIIDGTGNYKLYDRIRFPAALLGYLNWFLAYNEAVGGFIPDPGFQSYLQDLHSTPEFSQLVDNLREFHPAVRYSIRTWSPMADYQTTQVVIGNDLLPYVPPNFSDSTPQVILVNSVNDPSQIPSMLGEYPHVPGYFDSERLLEYPDLVFTRFGLGIRKNWPTEAEFVAQIQRVMREKMAEMVNLTNPSGEMI